MYWNQTETGKKPSFLMERKPEQNLNSFSFLELEFYIGSGDKFLPEPIPTRCSVWVGLVIYFLDAGWIRVGLTSTFMLWVGLTFIVSGSG